MVACGGADAPRIDDPAFAARAERACARALPALRADLTDDDPPQPDELAPVVSARADSLRSLVAGLRTIPVVPDAEPEVEAWLADWAVYVDVGVRYGKALESGDPRRYAAVAEEGAAPQARISAFARANGFESCALDGVPLPPREGL